MDEPIEVIEYRGFNIKIYSDFDPLNPIEEWDWFGKMVTWHNNYSLGHEQPKCDPDEFLQQLAIEADPTLESKIDHWENGKGWIYLYNRNINDTAPQEADQLIKALIEKTITKHYITLPLYLFDHSGITIATRPFSCPWDSGQVGYIHVSIKDILKEFNRKHMSKKLRQKAIDLMIGEVNSYDQYLTGEIYGYQIEPTDKNKSIECDDSCWGFYGYEHDKSGLLESAKPSIYYAIKEYKESVRRNHRRVLQLNAFMQSSWAY